jgi:hypothetical protein
MLARHESSDTQPLVAPLSTSHSLESPPPGTVAGTICPSSSSSAAPTPYKRELFVGINSPMAAAFCFSTIAIMPSISASFDFGLANGGPSTMVWGFLIASGFTIATTASLAEICSVYPGAGSAYYWTGNLAPSAWAPIMAFYCGFLSVIGNLAFLSVRDFCVHGRALRSR